LLATAATGPAFADSGGAASPAPVPAWEQNYSPAARERLSELDRYIAERRWDVLMQSAMNPTTAEEGRSGLDWAKFRMDEGGPTVVSLIYTRMTWIVGQQGGQFAPLKITAGTAASYAVLQMLADGPKCADESAPRHHIESTLTGPIGHDILGNFARLPRDPSAQYSRDKMVTTVLLMEKLLATRRGNDDWLCGGGSQEFAEFFAKHPDFDSPQHPAPSTTAPGQVGRQVQIPYDPTIVPKYVAGEIWQPKQAAARQQFPVQLNSLLDKLAAVPATAPPSGK
jgi:hypothetical protein